MRNLKSLLACEDLVVAPGAHDGLAARVFEQAGFRAVYMTGNGVSASLLAAPDVGLLTMTEMASHARAMVSAVGVPVIADGDTGYGNRDNVARTVWEYESAGVAAMHLEDQVFPKRCAAMGATALIPAEDHAAKIAAAIAARSSAEFLIIGRTDARLSLGFEEALRRARCYADAGADLVLVEMLQTAEEIETVVRTIEAPVMFNAVSGKTPELTPRQFGDLGVRLLVYPLASTLIYAATMQHLACHLAEGNSPLTFHPAGLDLTEYARILKAP